MITNKTILILGGTGSLGYALVEKYITNNKIICYSRDECKQWEMRKRIQSKNLSFELGDIRDYMRLKYVLIKTNPHIVIIAAALKHIDVCENFIQECLKTNITGINNILNVIELHHLNNLETVCFISTDKACCPVNVYGMCKSISEKNVIARQKDNVKFVCVRYGNVLNSRGSIIPLLHKYSERDYYELTHEDMTRFIMTLEESTDLIDHAILYAESGDIVIPEIRAMKIRDLMEIFAQHYNKSIKITGLRQGEKLSESLVSDQEICNVIDSHDPKFKYIRANNLEPQNKYQTSMFNSDNNIVTIDQLREYLVLLKLL